MLAKAKYEALVQILSNEEARFEDSLTAFTTLFGKVEYFRAGWVVQHIIRHNVRAVHASRP